MRKRVAEHFTAREVQILELVALGLADKEIAAQLRISKRTVGTHLHRIYERRGLRSRAAAAVEWWRTKAPNYKSGTVPEAQVPVA